MDIKRFYDEGLAHASYVVTSGNQAVVIDPARNPEPYLDYLQEKNAKLIGIIETHPHADFVSSHRELAEKTGADIYVSDLVAADYPHKGFDEGQYLQLNGVKLKALNTPGHSPDSISVLLEDENGKDRAIFTGDTLFIGDVGRPDLREKAGNIQAKREELARMMYKTTREKFMPLDEDIEIYPAHGPGSLCGKGISEELSSTIGEQLKTNYAFKEMSEDEFVKALIEGQPFIPKYFSYDVEVNKRGARAWRESIETVPRLQPGADLDRDKLVVDGRSAEQFRAGHLSNAINIQDGDKFETWLGTLIDPRESFYLIAENEEQRETLIRKAAKIGYEALIEGAVVFDPAYAETKNKNLQLENFKAHPENYTIVDVRNSSEVEDGKIFDSAIHRPLSDLREDDQDVPTDKPVVVHCAGGYRSAAGASILQQKFGDQTEVYDLSEAVKEFSEMDEASS